MQQPMLPGRKSPLGFPMAPSQEEWDALSTEEKAEVYEALPNQVTYAEMSPPEGDQHRRAKERAADALNGYFQSRKRRAYVTSELPVYYPKAPRFAPDVLVVFDVADQERSKWVVSKEGRGLDWVLEVHYGGDRKKDAERNVERYAQLRIPEYFLFDRAEKRLHAYRLPSPDARVYVPIVPQRAIYSSTVLGLDVHVEGERLRFYDGTAMLLDSGELRERLEEALDETLIQASAAHERAVAAEARAEAERAENERLRAELEALKQR